MKTYRGKDHIELVFSKSDLAKLSRGHVVHAYSAPHYARGEEVVALRIELPHDQHYRRLGYSVAATFLREDIRGHRFRIGKKLNSNTLENQKAVSEAQQPTMRDLERETPAAVSAQLATAFATPHVKEGLTRLVSHKQDLEQLIRGKWAILQSSERHFALDRTRTYPVLVTVPLLQNMGLSCLTFIPGKLPFPSITVNVELGTGGHSAWS